MKNLRYSFVALFCVLNLLFTGTTNEIPRFLDFVKFTVSINQCDGPCTPLHAFVSYKCQEECVRNILQVEDRGCVAYSGTVSIALRWFSYNECEKFEVNLARRRIEETLIASTSEFLLTVQKLE
jgi:hypothetical protein